MNTTLLPSSSFREQDEVINFVLDGAPTPIIDITHPSSGMWVSTSKNYFDQYRALFVAYTQMSAVASKDEYEETYGFSSWTPSHPLFRQINLDSNRHHVYHVEGIIAQVEKEVRATEIMQGWKYEPKDKIFLIHERVTNIRNDQMRYVQEDHDYAEAQKAAGWRDSLLPIVDTRSAADKAVEFNNRHPILTGFLASMFYQKAKSVLGK